MIFTKIKDIHIATIFTIVAMLVFGCKGKEEHADQAELDRIARLPSQKTTHLNTMISDSGRIKTVLSSPLCEDYKNAEEAYWLFPEGLSFTNYISMNVVDGSITCNHARYFVNRDLWELRDSVNAMNSKKELFETELLYWDRKTQKVYTDKFIKVTRPDEILTGYGLDSNQEFSKWSIRKVTGTFKLKVNN